MYHTIGIDLGTSGVKVILLSTDGKVVDSTTKKYTPDFLGDGKVEQDPEIWYKNTIDSIVEIISRNSGIEINALAISGQMHGSVFLDKDGNVIRPAILWNDTRTSKEVEEITNIIGEKNLIEATCNIALEGFTLPKILWLKNNEPNNYAMLEKVVLPKDYINYRLTGILTQEITDAAGTLAFDVKNRKWATEILEKLNLKVDMFPQIIDSTEVIGNVKEEITSSWNIDKKILVVGGGADNSCASIGNGVLQEGDGIISIGTSGTVVKYINQLDKELDGSVHVFNYSYPNSYYAMGVMLCAGESLNYAKRLLFEDCEISEMIEMARKSSVGSNKLIYLPYVFGERCPHRDPNAKGLFFGLSPTTSKEDMIRSILEGVSFGMYDLYEGVSKITDEVNNLYVTGGGAKSELWAQILADVFNKELKIINIDEGPALGAAMIAGVGTSLYTFEEISSRTIAVRQIVIPVSANVEKYKMIRPIYQDLYKSNKDNFKKIGDLDI